MSSFEMALNTSEVLAESDVSPIRENLGRPVDLSRIRPA